MSSLISSGGHASILLPLQVSHTLWSDALGSWGCGALCLCPLLVPSSMAGDMAAVPHSSQRNGAKCHYSRNVGALLELLHCPSMFRQHGSHMCCLSWIGSRSSPHAPPGMFTFLRCPLKDCVVASLRVGHMAEVLNTAANALSRDKHDVFLFCVPQAPPMLSHVPQSLLDMLLLSQPDWTSSGWRTLFLTTLRSNPEDVWFWSVSVSCLLQCCS